ncbi:1-acyl-sn-glycerol-3-phosphate acyltransferase [Marinobacter xestospongiae]|uniref:1-acyl-sn-glycerol-3-phosphate acyltransferase n=1 Tax=Marinobacter xestospongiae TaxID=994319 RepID=A0ABU3W2V9_9GAMM|nr:1-acyl-sn-glycerol-3-phosphate acyltransferase [Marinobacter xestospongiae]MDV2080675.1 1-acyl-sn-glycerol-3-phosphate acyltransferase [Marinobacter xestospongiae]
MQEFDAIRPYSDEETEEAIQRLLGDAEFLDLIARFKSPTLSRWLPGLIRGRVRNWLRDTFGGLTRIDDIQARLYEHVEQLVDHTTTRVTHTGLDKLDPNTPYLFLSNHRDIVFDPLVVNYLLFRHGFATTRIAIGDNLLQNRVFAELMRMNKSFVVRRNVSSPREMRDTFLTLSSFISHSIETGHSVWIAQREGRAKDGLDLTDPAIIKMFYMSLKKQGLAFNDAMDRLRIVPVSIAYEYDPCDTDKARELETRARTGDYTKQPGEDTDQIIKGLTGFKGHVHVHFSDPIKDAPETPRELAARIDTDMHANYHLHASNLAAYELRSQHPDSHNSLRETTDTLVTAETWSPAELDAAEQELSRRLNSCDEPFHSYLLDMYANPVTSALNTREPEPATGPATQD